MFPDTPAASSQGNGIIRASLSFTWRVPCRTWYG